MRKKREEFGECERDGVVIRSYMGFGWVVLSLFSKGVENE